MKVIYSAVDIQTVPLIMLDTSIESIVVCWDRREGLGEWYRKGL